jgi:hypothetical protein
LELRSGSGFHNILNQLICSLVWVRICLFPLTRRWTWVNANFCAKKNSNVHRWSFISNYLDLSFDVSRLIPKVYPNGHRFFELF